MGSETKQSPRPDINFDSLRAAITPINLMFDGRLYKDLKGLTSHIMHAIKKVNKERPDYQAAILEINLLESAFNSAVMQWEQKLTTEIQMLKNSIESSQNPSLGAAKKISKYQEELTRGRGSTRSFPVKLGQVRSQLVSANGHAGGAGSEQGLSALQSRLNTQARKTPAVYKNAAAQVLRKVAKSPDANVVERALKVFRSLSKPVKELDKDAELQQGTLYFLNDSPAAKTGNELVREKTQFVTILGTADDSNAYVLESIFADSADPFELSFEDFNRHDVSVFRPLENMELILQLLDTKFDEEDFPATFKQYSFIRQKAFENKRDDKFNPRQQKIHSYLTELIFDFIGLSFDTRSSEVRFIGEINTALQVR